MPGKRLKWMFCSFLLIISMCFCHRAFAGGAYLPELASPGSVGTAGVFNAVNTVTPDAAVTNPAGMTGMKDDMFMGGFQLLLPEVRFDASIADGGGTDGDNAGVATPIPGLYGVKVLSDRWRAGLGVSAPLGGGANYGREFVGRYMATKVTLAGLSISPSVGYRITDRVSAGIGVSLIYTTMDYQVALNQNAVVPGTPDGEINFDGLDDWGYQGFLGLTWQISDKAMLGCVYRTKIQSDLEGPIEFNNVQVPILNLITSQLDRAKISWDFPQLFQVGLKLSVSEKLTLLFDADWEEWSSFSANRFQITGGPISTIQTIDRGFDDTWHVGAGMIYKLDENFISMGFGYDTSPVDDDKRTVDLPLDEQVRFGLAYAGGGEETPYYAIGFSFLWLGKGETDQVAQGVRFKGEFDSNYILFFNGALAFDLG
jgi:long-chain fatty acid transport protein